MARRRKSHPPVLPQGRSHSRKSEAISRQARTSAPKTRKPAVPAVRWAELSAGKRLQILAGGVLLLAAFLWAYWPTLQATVRQWRIEPDYSHGFLVLPIALFFLWARRARFLALPISPSMAGAVLLLAVCGLRYLVGLYYLSSLDAWTIPLWVAGAVLLLFGTQVLWWSLPSVVFLWFMLPIPYSAERMLSLPLQRVAAKASTAVLRMLNQPALAEGNVIWIGDHALAVEEACSGLRILVGVFALAFAFVLFSRWSWWQKGIALLMAIPIAILANVTRIVVTGILSVYISSEAGNRFSHDLAGLFMIPLAAALFWGCLVYLDKAFPLVEEVQPRLLVGDLEHEQAYA